MKRFMAVTGAALAVALPGAFAQTDTAPQATPAATAAPAETPAPAEVASSAQPLLASLQNLHVAVLETGEGGFVAVQSPEGENAVLAYLTPKAALAAKQAAGDDESSVTVIFLTTLLQNWDGAVVFESRAEEIAHAKELAPEVKDFLAPVYFVTTDGRKVGLSSEQGPIFPILTGYADANELAAKYRESNDIEGKVEIIPIEFAALLQQLSSLETDAGYRVFTHPDTVAVIKQAESQAAAPSE